MAEGKKKLGSPETGPNRKQDPGYLLTLRYSLCFREVPLKIRIAVGSIQCPNCRGAVESRQVVLG